MTPRRASTAGIAHPRDTATSPAWRAYPCGSAAGATDRGRVRDRNEDAWGLSAIAPPVLVVADGMGGHPAGEVASQIAVDTVLTHLAPPDRPAAAERPRLPGLLDAVLAAHAAVLAAAARRPDWRGMGTALAVARVCGPRLETCHVGDVRVYLARRGQFLQLTQDHSLAIQLLHAGQLTPAQARGDRSRHRLSQALGGAHPLQPECHAEALQDRDLVLLCSDGLWEAMDDTALAGILAAPDDLSSRLAALVEAANTAGGRDNITAVLYQHQPRSGDP